ncbi:MAG TPA: substrate-binding domain-containing protein [Candidatus Limnocylindrales bacterium]|nr:substrate-binding domain-containing protein [Candidatus Limnocylindrales bacterium]
MEAKSDIWLEMGGKIILNDRSAKLLTAIEASGSLKEAVEQCKMSYRNAWGLLRKMEAASGIKFVQMRWGGGGEAHCRLTPEGKEWLSKYLVFREKVENFVQDEFTRIFKRLKLSTTTSVVSSGLLSVLLSPFERQFNIKVEVYPVGTGKALELAAAGQVDAVLVHARKLEERFLQEGHGVNRRDIMYNQFVLVGPPQDQAQVSLAKTAVDAFKRIARQQALFLSRGDDSGTHCKEKEIWELARINPQGKWYVETKKGMLETLQMAQKQGAYTLTDRGTFLTLPQQSNLALLFEGDPVLFNPYSIIAVNPLKHPQVKYVMAMALIGWLTSQEQRIIQEFGKDKFGQPLFYPVLLSQAEHHP